MDLAIEWRPGTKLEKKAQLRPSKALQIERWRRDYGRVALLKSSDVYLFHETRLKELQLLLGSRVGTSDSEEFAAAVCDWLRTSKLEAELGPDLQYSTSLRGLFGGSVAAIVCGTAAAVVGILTNSDQLVNASLIALGMGGALGYGCLSKAEEIRERDA